MYNKSILSELFCKSITQLGRTAQGKRKQMKVTVLTVTTNRTRWGSEQEGTWSKAHPTVSPSWVTPRELAAIFCNFRGRAPLRCHPHFNLMSNFFSYVSYFPPFPTQKSKRPIACFFPLELSISYTESFLIWDLIPRNLWIHVIFSIKQFSVFWKKAPQLELAKKRRHRRIVETNVLQWRRFKLCSQWTTHVPFTMPACFCLLHTCSPPLPGKSSPWLPGSLLPLKSFSALLGNLPSSSFKMEIPCACHHFLFLVFNSFSLEHYLSVYCK